MREGFITDIEPSNGGSPAEIPAPAPAPDPYEPPPEVWPIKVRLLHRSIRDSAGNQTKEISFREPTGGDINRYGNPVRVNQDGDVIIDERKMTSVMAVLSGILTPFLETMDPRDWNSCAYRLRNFFLPNPEAW